MDPIIANIQASRWKASGLMLFFLVPPCREPSKLAWQGSRQKISEDHDRRDPLNKAHAHLPWIDWLMTDGAVLDLGSGSRSCGGLAVARSRTGHPLQNQDPV